MSARALAARGAQGQGGRRARDLRGGAASLHAHRRIARLAGSLRHQHQDEPAAARGRRPRRDARRHRRRHGRRRSPPITRRITTTRRTSSSTARRSASSASRPRCPLSLDRLVHAGLIRLPRLVELMSVNPARILRVPGGSLSEGAPADITILAPDLRGAHRGRAAAVAVEEHAVRRLGAPRRRRRDDRRRAHGVRQSGRVRWDMTDGKHSNRSRAGGRCPGDPRR